MKNLLYIFIVLACVSCKKDPNYGAYADLENSRRAWTEYKTTINNSYSYISYSGSVFGFFSETTITVIGGKVTARTYKAGEYVQNTQGPPTEKINKSWTEDSATLNSHTEGQPSLTLDEIYERAKTQYHSNNTPGNDFYFSKDASSLIASFGYVPKGCMDDCFNGLNIKSIKPVIF